MVILGRVTYKCNLFTCFTIKDLDITGVDLIEYGLKGAEIGNTLNTLLDIVIENPKLNDKATLIALLDNLK